VSFLFYGDDLSGLGEQRDEFVEIGLDRGPAAVDEHQGCPARLGLAVNFVIHPK
jgi:hypothetical protein